MFIYLLLITSSIAAFILLARTLWSLRRFSYVPHELNLSSELPTISICIAARNETHALARCLERIINSDYKKLEILVLDDSSNDDTSLIIKSFAHAGVRFIPGKELPEGWLGKNHAYQTLIDEASGDFVMFLDVDTLIDESTVSQLVGYQAASGASMVSVLPRRNDGLRASAVFGTMRYYWELLLGSAASPPAASALWMVSAETLQQDGIGLRSYALSVRPERHLARQIKRIGTYRYIIGTKNLGVRYEKRLTSQYETAIRLYYPMNGRTLLRWLLASLYMMLLIVPLGLIVFVIGDPLKLLWSLGLIGLVAISFGLFVRRTYGQVAWLLRVIAGPFLMIQELILLMVSYFKYRTNNVTWKGRRVTAQPSRRDALNISE